MAVVGVLGGILTTGRDCGTKDGRGTGNGREYCGDHGGGSCSSNTEQQPGKQELWIDIACLYKHHQSQANDQIARDRDLDGLAGRVKHIGHGG